MSALGSLVVAALFLVGWLREQLDVPIERLKQYAGYVLKTMEKRLKDGPLLPESLYEGRSMLEILENLDRSTMARFRKIFGDEWSNMPEDERPPNTILRQSATEEQIIAAEKRSAANFLSKSRTSFAFRTDVRPSPVVDGVASLGSLK